MKSSSLIKHLDHRDRFEKRRALMREPFRQKVMSPEQIRLSLRYSYISEKLWVPYLSLYEDLFLTREDAECKSKTHSLMIMCRNIRNQYGCSYDRIYKELKKEMWESEFVASEKLLKMETKWDFMECLYEI